MESELFTERLAENDKKRSVGPDANVGQDVPEK